MMAYFRLRRPASVRPHSQIDLFCCGARTRGRRPYGRRESRDLLWLVPYKPLARFHNPVSTSSRQRLCRAWTLRCKRRRLLHAIDATHRCARAPPRATGCETIRGATAQKSASDAYEHDERTARQAQSSHRRGRGQGAEPAAAQHFTKNAEAGFGCVES